MFAQYLNFGNCLGPVHAEWPQDPFVTLNGLIVRLGILSQTLVWGDPVCTKQVPGQYQELTVPGTAFIPGLTNSYRGSFAHLLQWKRLNITQRQYFYFQLQISLSAGAQFRPSHTFINHESQILFISSDTKCVTSSISRPSLPRVDIKCYQESDWDPFSFQVCCCCPLELYHCCLDLRVLKIRRLLSLGN